MADVARIADWVRWKAISNGITTTSAVSKIYPASSVQVLQATGGLACSSFSADLGHGW